MEIVKELFAADNNYKSVITKREDGLYEIDCQYCDVWGYWNSIIGSTTPNHLTDTLENAIKIGKEQLQILPGQELDAMTVNECLAVRGMLDKFKEAITARDKQKAISILVKVRLIEEQATDTVEAIFNNPEYYGYKK